MAEVINMLWAQKWIYKFNSMNKAQGDSHKSSSHGFSDRPYINNSKHTNSFFISGKNFSHPTELWHYGILGMHWGETTKEYKKVGSRFAEATPSVSIKKSSLKDSKAKIAKLQNVKRQMQNKRTKVIRYKNKVLTVKVRPKTKEERLIQNEKIASNGAAKINNILSKIDDLDAKYINKPSNPSRLQKLLRKKV